MLGHVQTFIVYYEWFIQANLSLLCIKPDFALHLFYLMKRFWVLFLWILLILSGYYLYHKPVRPEEVWSILQAGISVLSAVAMITLCGATGTWLFRESAPEGLPRWAVQTALGAGVWSLIWLGAGLSFGYTRWIFWLPFLLLLPLRKQVREWISPLGRLSFLWKDTSPLEKVLAGMALLLILAQLWIALAPPAKYDALTYHLALPRQYLEAGKLLVMPENPYWGHPQLAEMLYTWAMGLFAPQSATVFSWLISVVFWLGLWGWIQETVEEIFPHPASPKSGWIALIAVLSGASVRWMSAWAYTDLFSGLFGLSALIAFTHWLKKRQTGWYLWMCLFIGMAVSVKYTSGVLALVLFPAVWFFSSEKRRFFGTFLLGGLLALAVFLPWMLKNWGFTGNPFFPYLIPTTEFSAWRLSAANQAPESVDWLMRLFLPVTFTWMGVDGAAGPATDIGPLLVLLALPGWWRIRHTSLGKLSGWSFLLLWVILGVGGARYEHLQQTRLYFALLPLIALNAGMGWEFIQEVRWREVRLSRLVMVLVLLVSGLTLWQDSFLLVKSQAVPAVLGVISPEAYLENQTGVYIQTMTDLKKLPEGSKVLFLWEARSFYAPSFCIADPWIDRWRADLHESGSPQTVLETWRKEGITHILIHKTGMEFMRDADRAMSSGDWQAFDELLKMLPPAQPLAGGYYLLIPLTP